MGVASAARVRNAHAYFVRGCVREQCDGKVPLLNYVIRPLRGPSYRVYDQHTALEQWGTLRRIKLQMLLQVLIRRLHERRTCTASTFQLLPAQGTLPVGPMAPRRSGQRRALFLLPFPRVWEVWRGEL